MTIAKLAYLTTPDPGRYILHFQPFGSEELTSIEIAPEQMKNILTAGVSVMLQQSFHRVPLTKAEDAPHERAAGA